MGHFARVAGAWLPSLNGRMPWGSSRLHGGSGAWRSPGRHALLAGESALVRVEPHLVGVGTASYPGVGRVDRGHVLGGQREVEDADVLGDAVGLDGLRDGGQAVLDVPAEDDLGRGGARRSGRSRTRRRAAARRGPWADAPDGASSPSYLASGHGPGGIGAAGLSPQKARIKPLVYGWLLLPEVETGVVQTVSAGCPPPPAARLWACRAQPPTTSAKSRECTCLLNSVSQLSLSPPNPRRRHPGARSSRPPPRSAAWSWPAAWWWDQPRPAPWPPPPRPRRAVVSR